MIFQDLQDLQEPFHASPVDWGGRRNFTIIDLPKPPEVSDQDLNVDVE